MLDRNRELKQFSKTLSKKLDSITEKGLAKELDEWDTQYFTTSSEFLGELKIILNRVNQLKTLDEFTKREVGNCIAVINKAFGM